MPLLCPLGFAGSCTESFSSHMYYAWDSIRFFRKFATPYKFATRQYFQAGRNVRDLFEDLRDGHNLLSLLEVLSGEILVSVD